MFDPEPWIESEPDGGTITISGKAWFYDHQRSAFHCTSLMKGQRFLLAGVKLTGDRFSVIAASKRTQDGLQVLEAQPSSIQIHAIADSSTATEVIDICSGYAIMTAGYKYLNCRVRCHVEINPTYAGWLKAKREPVIQGDISSPQVLQALLEYTATPCIVTGGFACQPFSALGDRRQQLDPRARSFEGMVMVGYVHQPLALILECTKEAMMSTWVQDTLRAFCQNTGYRMQQQTCSLQDFWPAKRTRWWAVITHPHIKMPDLRGFPSLDFKPAFRHLLPKLPRWPDSHVEELQLTPDELEVFATQPGGLGQNAVCPTKPLSTALHAWGSQLRACACGCRAGGFSPQRLEDKGLYGALIPLEGTTQVRGQDIANMRHVHPDEVAVLHLVPTDHLEHPDTRRLRLDLTALGQMASPAQALWHVSQVVQALRHAFGEDVPQSLPEQSLLQLSIATFEARDMMLQPFAHTRESMLFQTAVLAKFGVRYDCPPHQAAGTVSPGTSESHASIRETNKRKAEDELSLSSTSCLFQGVSPTGGLEFFANRTMTHASVDYAHPSGHSAPIRPQSCQGNHQAPERAVTTSLDFAGDQTQVLDLPSHAIVSHARGKGKGGISPFRVDLHEPSQTHKQNAALVPPTQVHPDQQSPSAADAETEDPDPPADDARSSMIAQQLLPKNKFQVVVCRQGGEPFRMQVSPGATVGQLSQAEAEATCLPQPIVIKTLTGIPHPLNSFLTPGTWYVVDNGAIHSLPKCSQVHAHQAITLDLQGSSRFHGLLEQGPLVAVDEMCHYVRLLRNQGYQVADPIVLDSAQDLDQSVATWALQCLHAFDIDHRQSIFMAPLLCLSHWSPIALHVSPTAKTLLVPQDIQKHITQLITEALGPFELTVESFLLPSEFAADCGFQTVGWFFSHGLGAPFTKATTAVQADHWRVPFAQSIIQPMRPCTEAIRLGGTLQPEQLLLQAVLKQHGVHQDRLSSCATNLLQHLGAEAINKALGSSQPWKDLKTLASQASPPIRIVLAAEIDDAIQKRLASGKPVGNKANKKPPHKGQKPPVIPSADQIKLPDAIFAQSDGQKLPSIPLHKVEAHAQGVALCNIGEVTHFLSLSAPISTEGVALLILDHTDIRLPEHVERIRVPAMSASTGEPMLVSAAMLQLGGKRVVRFVPKESFALEEIQTRVLKVLVYKDEWNGQWSSFIKHPVKAIFEHTLMQDPAFPQAEHIIDVWDRQTLDAKLARAQTDQAEVFAFMIRVTEGFAEVIMPSAAVDGIYLEPRTLDGRKPDPHYRVIWMPRQSLAQVRLARSQTEAKTTIARMGNRFGLRVDRHKAEQVHVQHRPDLMFLDGHELKPYRVGPFPYGSTKESISKGFKHLGWNARPVQPISQMQVQEGIFWQVMAPQEPTHWIYQMKHGDILIAKQEDQKETALPATGHIIASKKTISTLKQPQSDMPIDPWLQADPWQAPQTGRKPTATPTMPIVTPGQLAALESRLEQKIHASASETKEDTMQVEQTSRIEALEMQVNTLTQSFSTFQGHQAKINQQIASQLQGFEGRIDSKLEDQMQRIESLLSKKMRHE